MRVSKRYTGCQLHMIRVMFVTLFSFMCAHWTYAQMKESMPVLLPSYTNHFYQEESSFVSKCFENAVVDEKGRLWLGVCGVHSVLNSIGVLSFDGYEFHNLQLADPQGLLAKPHRLVGISSLGKMFGIVFPNKTSHIFFIDPATHETEYVAVPRSEEYPLSIRGISETADKGFLLLGLRNGTDSLEMLSLKNGQLARTWIREFPGTRWSRRFVLPVVDTPEETWYMLSTSTVYRFDKAEQEHKEYSFVNEWQNSDADNRVIVDLRIPYLIHSVDGVLFALMIRENGTPGFFQYSTDEDRFISMKNDLPSDWAPEGIFVDQIGQLCFLFKDEHDTYKAILRDTLGAFYDYSRMVEQQSQITRLIATDFFKQVFVTSTTGLFSVGLRQSDAIRHELNGTWISSMIELPNGEILVNSTLEEWYTLDPVTGRSAQFDGPDCGVSPSVFQPGMKQQLHKDRAGQVWFLSDHYLVEYDPMLNTCRAFDLGRECKLFAFMDDRRVVLVFGGNKIGIYDTGIRDYVDMGAGIPSELPGRVRDLYFDDQGILWIPTNYGLWKLNLEKGETDVLGLDGTFGDVRFPCIYGAPDGKIWLGTYFSGLVIYDPVSGLVKTIDHRQGLSSNAVMSLVADDQGDVWVGTEYGITLISKEGDIIREFHRGDGLGYEVFERFDAYKDGKGRLYFGSRNGLTIIDPGRLKSDLKHKENVHLFVTEMSYFDSQEERDVVKHGFSNQLEEVDLPANRRYLRVNYAVSSYVEPGRNRYAYKLDGIDDKWNYVGNQHELVLNHLPAGKYDILIKGSDYANNWTNDPLVISVNAREYFYNQRAFYAGLVGLVALIAFFWVRRLRTEKLRLESEVNRRTSQIRSDKEIIQRQAQSLRQLDEMKSRFFTNISHELRTPITLINLPVEQILTKSGQALSENMQRNLETILRNGKNLLRLVDELFDLSRLEEGKLELNKTDINLYGFFLEVYEAFENTALHNEIDFQLTCDLPENAFYRADSNRLRTIVSNLISNALKFTPRGGQVRVSVQEGKLEKYPGVEVLDQKINRELAVVVSDSGPGIDSEDLPKIFQRYFQAENGVPSASTGMGIGLALSAELTKLMNGTLTVDSEPGKGSVFTLRVPMARDLSDRQIKNVKASGESVLEEVELRDALITPNEDSYRLLIVEDNVEMQHLLQTLLSERYHCLIVGNGKEAWDKIESKELLPGDVDLIISDIMMPEMDGYTLLALLKKEDEWQNIPVIMLTARTAQEDKLRALRLGIDDYLTKPFSEKELLLRVYNLIHNAVLRQNFRKVLEPALKVGFEDVPSSDQQWLEQLEEVAKNALQKKLPLTKVYLAQEMAVSERHLLRLVKELTGLTVSKYILEVKLQKARHLLESHTFPTIAEVSFACGFRSPGYFSKVFEKHYGKKPSDF